MTLVADTAEAPARALAPSESGFAESRGVRLAYEVFGEGEQTLLLLPPWSIIHSRFWKGQVRLPRPALPRDHLRPSRQRALRPARSRRRLRPADRRRGRARRARRHRHRALRVRRPLRHRGRRAAARGRPRRARRRRGVHDARPPAHPAAARAHRLRLRGGAHRVRGLGEDQPALLGAGLPRLPRVLLRALLPGAALDQADRGLRLVGPRGAARDARAHDRGARPRRADDSRAARAHPLPAARDPGRRGRADPARSRRGVRRGDGRRARVLPRASATARTPATRCPST